MSDDTKPVPEPGEAERDEAIHYYEVDETDVGDTAPPKSPHADDTELPEADD
jgi:hypothetical protein